MQGARPEDVLLVANSRHGPEGESPAHHEGAPHDHFVGPAEAVAYLRRELPAVPAGEPTREQLAALREIRDAARALFDGNVRDWQRRTERLLRRSSYRLDLDAGFLPLGGGWDGFVEALLPGLVALRDERQRIKVCENDRCGWLFLDRTKNRSRVWCEGGSCGNRMRARRFRERHAE